jgi:hypothetical protein
LRHYQHGHVCDGVADFAAALDAEDDEQDPSNELEDAANDKHTWTSHAYDDCSYSSSYDSSSSYYSSYYSDYDYSCVADFAAALDAEDDEQDPSNELEDAANDKHSNSAIVLLIIFCVKRSRKVSHTVTYVNAPAVQETQPLQTYA